MIHIFRTWKYKIKFLFGKKNCLITISKISQLKSIVPEESRIKS